MRLVQVGIKPESAFGTPLKGDTIFGHFIWQLAMDNSLLKIPFDEAIAQYKSSPFIIFSSAYPRLYRDNGYEFFLKKPDMPMSFLTEELDNTLEYLKNRKKLKKKEFIRVGEDLKVTYVEENLFSEEEIYELYEREYSVELPSTSQLRLRVANLHTHNKINRLSFTTGNGFAPYTLEDIWFLPNLELAIFILFDEETIDLDSILIGLERIGLMGFGRDASSGLGRFTLAEEDELKLPKLSNCDGIYTLSPCVPDKNYMKIFFTPFVRFGRHGSFLANSTNPFKNPILMMDEGSVIIHNDEQNQPFVGRCLNGLSKVEEATISQGYSIVLPLFFGKGS